MLLEDVYEENCRFRFVVCEQVGFMVLFLEIVVILPAMYKMSDCDLAKSFDTQRFLLHQLGIVAMHVIGL